MSVPPACADDCLLLLDHPHAALQDGGFCDLCGEHVPEACELDWPSGDVMPCDRADWLRNCLYARLGYDFDTAPEWRVVLDDEPWYAPDPAFSWSAVSPVRSANVKWLKRLVSKRQCPR